MTPSPHSPPVVGSAPAPAARTDSPPPVQPPQPRRWTSRELLGSSREVEIEHEGHLYRLRLTSLGKLILTK